MPTVNFELDPDGKLGRQFNEWLAVVQDLTIPLEEIRLSWFKGNRSIFAISGPGKFADLTTNYKKQKLRKRGFIYPILLSSGRLKGALTVPGGPGSIAQIMNKRSLTVGVDPNDKIFNYLYGGTSKMKARPYVLLGAEQVAPAELNPRVEIWRKIMIDYVRAAVGKR